MKNSNELRILSRHLQREAEKYRMKMESVSEKWNDPAVPHDERGRLTREFNAFLKSYLEKKDELAKLGINIGNL